MGKILGLDLGTNSIGWAIRDTDAETENQIIDYGVIAFQKGAGDGKSGEFSLAAERRKNRSKRRLYNAKRYRKWATLKVLMQSNMCPISEEELRLWSIGNWENYKKNKGRVYLSSPDFRAWLAMDFERIGQNVSEEVKLKPAFPNTYLLRCSLLEKYDDTDNLRLYKIGRAMYHLVQRRGFKTSRKSGKSSFAKNEELEKLKQENPEIQIAQVLQSKLQAENKRIRASGVIQRKYFEDEFYAICKKQNLSEDLTNKLYKAIYYVRPLRTQKGLVGKCTLEKGKPRIPISHPAFEEFRALSFINNIQWREVGSKNSMQPIPMQLKKKILDVIFFKKIEKGKNKGKIDDRTYVKFDEIIEKFSENGKWEFNYRNKPNVTVCPVIAGLMNVFDEEWKNKFIEDENKVGINWQELSLSYTVKYGKKKGEERILDYQDVWHLLFDYLQTKDKEEDLIKFCKEVLEWDDNKTNQFVNINIQQGYGSLSFSAIEKIIPFLQQGYIYSEAVSFANLSKVLGKENFENQKSEITQVITETIRSTDSEKEKLNIVNALIQKCFAEATTNRAKGVDDTIKEMAADEVDNKLKEYFTEDVWNKKTEKEKHDYSDFILEKYLAFLNGKQDRSEKASASANKNPEIDYYKLPRVDEAIKETLKDKFNATEAGLKHLYHPSDIDIYPKAKYNQLADPQPPSRAWKNPMAMRTMYELRKMLNYLIEAEKIDSDTKVVVEMARQLNDANFRWAIETYQRRREEQNIEFAKAILGVAKEKYPELKENDANNIDKVRLWWEQLENGEELYKQIKGLKEDVQKYRLWKEQESQCMYTGRMFSISDLFDGTKTQFEHTFPASISFDNSLDNLTVCDAWYNTNVKKNQIPRNLKNYDEEWNGYSAIKPRLKKWIDKVEHLKNLIEDNKLRTKKTQDPATKKDLIQKRHLLKFEFDYWDKKVKTFTLDEVPNSWKNSQLVDTQIISKYARAYLKTYFNRVDVQKGNITSEFRKIYSIMGDEKKNRTKHDHHAVDAAVLTLIPGSAKREEILRQYYEAIENNMPSYRAKPYAGFDVLHVLRIKDNLLINHVSKDQTLMHTKKKARKRGEIDFLKSKETKQYLRDANGNKIPKWLKGDSIRGQLNEETYFGAIKKVERNEDGFAIKENGKYKSTDEIWIVVRKPIEKINFDTDVIVDKILEKKIKEQLANGISVNDVMDFQNKPIRHLRCRVKTGMGFQSKEKTIELKKHSHQSKQKHKQYALSKIADNYLFLFYEKLVNEKYVRNARIISLFTFTQLDFNSVEELINSDEWNCFKKNEDLTLPLCKVIKVGQKVLFYNKEKGELKNLNVDELKKRLFVVYKFNESLVEGKIYNYIFLKNHIEARPNPEISKESDDVFDSTKYQPGLSIKKLVNMNCVFEEKDFEVKPDGVIKWLF